MAALAQQPPLFRSEPPAVVSRASFAPTWSNERAAVLTQEAIARLHSSNRPSIQAEYGEDEVVEFSSLPLVAVQIVRARFRDIGQLPPMNLEDEVGEFIDE